MEIKELRGRAEHLARHPRTRKVAIWVASILVAIGILGTLIAPPLLRQKLASELSKTLHREVSIQQIRINPYALSVWVRGFLVKERQGSGTAISFDELYVNLELSSLFRRGVVLKEIRLVKPYINLIRNEDLTYNFTDLIEEFTKGPPDPTPGPTPRFSLNNIQLVDGRIDFDDRPEGVKHAVTSVRIGVPFISSIPYYTDVKVEPAFSALVNGAPVEIGGDTKPFKDSRESTIHLEIDKLQIPKYLEYSPVELKFKMPSGEMDGKLSASFRTSKDTPVLAISGHVELQNLVLQEKNDSPILNLPSFTVVIDALEVFANKASFKAIKAQGTEVHVTRNRDGTLNLTSLVATGTKEKAPEPKKESTPFSYRVDEILLDQGKLHFNDQSTERPFQKRLEAIHISVRGLTTEPEKKAETEISFQTDAKEQFSHSGTLQLMPLAVEGKIDVEGLQLKAVQPYAQSVLAPEVKEGLLNVTSRFAFERKDETTSASLSELNVALSSFRLDMPGEREPLWRIPQLAVKETTVDLAKRSVVIGAVEGRDASGFVHRDRDGAISYTRLVKAAPASATQPKAPEKEGPPWTVAVKRVALDRFKGVFEDRSLGTPARIVVSELSARGENLSTAKNARGTAAIRAKVNGKGSLRFGGTLGTNPTTGRFDIEAQQIELLPFQPYWANQVNFILTGGAVGTKGNFVLEPASDGSSRMSYQGTLQVTDFSSVESSGTQDLLRWKSLELSGVQFSMQPVQLDVSDITLADFYSRVILASDGKINLQNLVMQKKDEPGTTSSTADPAGQGTADARDSTPPRTTIGKINLQGGNVHFSDFFVKPNYSVNLTQVQGSVSELKAETPGDLLLQAKIDNEAPVEINGKINPLAKDLFLDIKANARDIELSPLTPYSGKYVGYGIEKGKLSLDVQYRVENRKLSAQNKIILNQLTFGERIESPTATKAPVLLAVALLKDRNGVIDVNLPIGGSLDDPQFSVGGIVLQLVLNIITRAVTSPFTFLASAFGGGEELSHVEFDYGRARITPAAEGRLKTLATALNNRPALRLEISGRVDPVRDLEGLKRAALERKVKAQKMKELARKGAVPKSVDDVQIESSEYERYLGMAYGEESFPKPRNIVGLAKGLPVPEMEKLMLQHAQVTDADLRQLASQRAQVVRDYILATGQADADRLFIVASKPAGEEEKDKTKGKESRVDFSLR
ncbi:MAG TPA: DUF748 domain-containing protein [Candidatus Binatia bacterium]|jgi:uncharacterized protein involved in outer membrane biogenesis|nr:DUF748 domain-containing protein [Candidatus Binatia bacterium]